MTTAATPIAADDPVLTTVFGQELLRQMRALDTYGRQDKLPPEAILAPFVLTKEQRQAIPIVGEPDAQLIARVHAFYQAIAIMIEQECGLLAKTLIQINAEGFGRAVMTVGKLVVMDRTLRDVHRFGFASLSKMKDEADTILAVALDIIGLHPKVAGM